MTNTKQIKRALLSSVLALVLSFTMLLGTTFAWFTDSVTSSNNIIQSGSLEITMEWADGAADPASADWADASQGAIFDYDLWEPGYTVARHVRLNNEGTLALNYTFRIVANGELSKLAEVIEVYYFEDATQAGRDTYENGVLLGTLEEVLGTNKNISNTVYGGLLAGESRDFTLVLHMQEEAGNEYQNLSIADFSIEVLATQQSYEEDSFGPDYDDTDKVPSEAVPAALVTALDSLNVTATAGIGGTATAMELDVGYQFEPTITYEEAQNSIYRYYHADFVVYADKDVEADAIALAGYYDAWCKYNNDNWVAIINNGTPISAGTEIRLVESLGATVNWEEICNYGNDGIGFQCGAAALKDSVAGTTLTVELRLYETTKAWDATSGTANEETGNYITVGKFTYTFDAVEVDGQDALNEALANGATSINLGAGSYTMPSTSGELTISGTEDAIVNIGTISVDELTLNGVTVASSGSYYTGVQQGNTVVYNDCVIKNVQFLYADNVVFNGCTFEFEDVNDYVWTYGANNVTFTNCVFNTMGKAILVFQDGSADDVTVLVEGCTFNATAPAYNWDKTIHIAAVSIDGSKGGTYNVILNNNTVDSDFNGLWQDKTSAGNITVTVDGEVVLQ